MKQIQSLYTIAKNGKYPAALCAVVLAFAGFADADAMPSAHSHHVTSGNLTIAAPTEVGGVTLQPGSYQVRKANSADGPVMEFVQVVHNEQASELVQADEEEVVAQVKFTELALNEAAKQTRLIHASGEKDAMSLEIRGEAVGYVIATSPVADRAGTDCGMK